jgi:hypothetical protein
MEMQLFVCNCHVSLTNGKCSVQVYSEALLLSLSEGMHAAQS